MEYPSFKLVIVGDGGTGISLFSFLFLLKILNLFCHCLYQIVELGLLIFMVEAMLVSKDNNFLTDLQKKKNTVDV